jgi:hypothetical protein
MAFVKNKTLYVLADDGVTYISFKTVNDEIFLTADMIEGLFSYNDYVNAIRSRMSKYITRLYVLNEDESIRKDVSEYLISASIDLNYQQGQTRSCNVSLMNFNKEWLPSPVKGMLWKGTKFRLDLGIYYNGTVYWQQFGIFTPNDPSLSNDESNKTISLQMYDKFALLDGTLGGKSNKNFKINAGSSVRDAIQLCLNTDKGNGKVYDNKTLIFSSKYMAETVDYTISQTQDMSMGEIIITLANMISCDVYYNEMGNLVLTDGVYDIYMDNRPILWNYSKSELEYKNPNMTIDFSKIINEVTVKGAIVNGKQFKATVQNTNPQSQTNVNMTDITPFNIEDKNITSDELCLNRGKYEIKKKSILGLQVSFNSIFIPHLIHNGMVLWGNSDYSFSNEKFVISNIHIECNTEMLMNLKLSNLKEVALNG